MMKKMYLAIFLIILVVLVFAGCLSFSNTLGVAGPGEEDAGGVENPMLNEQDIQNGATEIFTITPVGNETPEGSSEGAGQVEHVVVPTVSQFDILKTGHFYMKGSMIDSRGTAAPMEMAITASSMYMLSDFEGASMGMLIKDGKVYMIYDDKKAYLEFTDSLMDMAGLDPSELTAGNEFDFSELGKLSEADSITKEALNGKECQVYHFLNEDSSEQRFYMDGTNLVRIASYTSSGKMISATDITEFSGTVPGDKCSPPSGYKAYKGMPGMVGFMTLLKDVIA